MINENDNDTENNTLNNIFITTTMPTSENINKIGENSDRFIKHGKNESISSVVSATSNSSEKLSPSEKFKGFLLPPELRRREILGWKQQNNEKKKDDFFGKNEYNFLVNHLIFILYLILFFIVFNFINFLILFYLIFKNKNIELNNNSKVK